MEILLTHRAGSLILARGPHCRLEILRLYPCQSASRSYSSSPRLPPSRGRVALE